MNKMDFKDKLMVVTGGSSGLGLAISKKIADQGAKVYLIARNESKLESAADQINQKNPNSAYWKSVDLSNPDALVKTLDEIESEENKSIDALVNNAGVYQPSDFSWDREHLQAFNNTMYNTPFYAMYHLIQKYKDTNHNLIVLNSLSQASFRVYPSGLAYGIPKTALLGAVQHIQAQLEAEKIDNVRVYGMMPGTFFSHGTYDNIMQGNLQNPASEESVLDTALNLLSGKMKHFLVHTRYNPEKGIENIYFSTKDFANMEGFGGLDVSNSDTIDEEYDPKEYGVQYGKHHGL